MTIGKAFDIVADKYSESRERLDDNGSYRADMNMTIKNRKEIPGKVVVILNNYYADDLSIEWQESNDVELEKRTSTEYHFSKILQPDEVWITEWVETYRA